jgi:hypothetical protein
MRRRRPFSALRVTLGRLPARRPARVLSEPRAAIVEVSPGVYLESMPPEYEPDADARPAELEHDGARRVDAILELVLLPDGRRATPLESLLFALERLSDTASAAERAELGKPRAYGAALEAELALLAGAIADAIEAPLPGHTPARADEAGGIPGLELVAPAFDEAGRQVHPDTIEPEPAA